MMSIATLAASTTASTIKGPITANRTNQNILLRLAAHSGHILSSNGPALRQPRVSWWVSYSASVHGKSRPHLSHFMPPILPTVLQGVDHCSLSGVLIWAQDFSSTSQ